jgi:hypothetical protein
MYARLKPSLKRQIKKASSLLIEETDDIQLMYYLYTQTFIKQNCPPPIHFLLLRLLGNFANNNKPANY